MLSGWPYSIRYLLLHKAIGICGGQVGLGEGCAFGRDHVQQLFTERVIDDDVRPWLCAGVLVAQGVGPGKEAAQRVKLEINMQFRRPRLPLQYVELRLQARRPSN